MRKSIIRTPFIYNMKGDISHNIYKYSYQLDVLEALYLLEFDLDSQVY